MKKMSEKYFLVNNLKLWELLSRIHGHSFMLILLERHISMLCGARHLAIVLNMEILDKQLETIINCIIEKGFANIKFRS